MLHLRALQCSQKHFSSDQTRESMEFPVNAKIIFGARKNIFLFHRIGR